MFSDFILLSLFFFSSRRRHTRFKCDWSSDVCSSDLVQTIIYPSFNFLYPSSGDTWLDAQATPVKTATLFSTVEAEEAVARFAASDPTKQRRGISLRLGAFYGPEAPSSWAMLDYARKGIGAFPGAPAGYLPQIWLQNAINALLLPLTEPLPSASYAI